MAWWIELAASVREQFKKVDHAEVKRIRDFLRYRIQPLGDPHQLGQSLQGGLAGLWRYRVGDYRVVCELRDETSSCWLCVSGIAVWFTVDMRTARARRFGDEPRLATGAMAVPGDAIDADGRASGC